MLTDLENVILELNETLLAAKVIQTKIALEIQKQIQGTQNEVEVSEAIVRNDSEKWMLELKTFSSNGFTRFRSLFDSTMTLEEWFDQAAWLRQQQNKLMTKLMEKVCESPTPLNVAYQLAQQYGACWIDNIFDVISVMATIVRNAPLKTKYYIHSGPMGQIYILIPKPGWSFSVIKDVTYWKFTSENPEPIKYELPRE